MDSENRLHQYSSEVEIGVSFGGLFSAVSIFFTGLLISSYDSFTNFVRIPLLFLILSTFGFVYATLIYANASGYLNRNNLKDCKKAIHTADILSEFMGVYSLLICIPLVIPLVTDDPFLVYSVLLIDALGLMVYHYSKFSIIINYFPNTHLLIALSLVLLMWSMVLIQNSNLDSLLTPIVAFTLLYLIFISFFSLRKIPQVD